MARRSLLGRAVLLGLVGLAVGAIAGLVMNRASDDSTTGATVPATIERGDGATTGGPEPVSASSADTSASSVPGATDPLPDVSATTASDGSSPSTPRTSRDESTDPITDETELAPDAETDDGTGTDAGVRRRSSGIDGGGMADTTR